MAHPIPVELLVVHMQNPAAAHTATLAAALAKNLVCKLVILNCPLNICREFPHYLTADFVTGGDIPKNGFHSANFIKSLSENKFQEKALREKTKSIKKEGPAKQFLKRILTLC